MPLAAAALFICTPIAVWDGDGPIWCEEGQKIRVANIAAREMDGTCRRGHPCPEASAKAARDALAALLGKPTGKWKTGHVAVTARGKLNCRSVGRSYGRVVATCMLPGGRDLGEAMLATGTVKRW